MSLLGSAPRASSSSTSSRLLALTAECNARPLGAVGSPQFGSAPRSRSRRAMGSCPASMAAESGRLPLGRVSRIRAGSASSIRLTCSMSPSAALTVRSRVAPWARSAATIRAIRRGFVARPTR
jgi:hypothetical protein